MIMYFIYYLFAGIAFNFLFDKLVDYTEIEEMRFTPMERVSTTLVWPIALIVFLYNFIRTLNQ